MSKEFELAKILLVASSKEKGILYQQALDPDYNIIIAHSGKEGLALVKSQRPDVVILSVNLPDISGFDICEKIRDDSHDFHYIGIVFVTESRDRRLILKVLDTGGDDFCMNEDVLIELNARVAAVLRVKRMTDALRDISEKLKQANKRLAKLTITDDLTGIYNMRYFNKRLKEDFTRAKRYNKYLSLIMFDIDHFKLVNDRCNHLMGSFVISKVGHELERAVRRNIDFPARYGGDEFIVLLPETDAVGARNFSERFLQKIRDTVFDNGEFQVSITISIGISTFKPGDTVTNALQLVKLADEHLYFAKNNGRDQIVDAESLPLAS